VGCLQDKNTKENPDAGKPTLKCRQCLLLDKPACPYFTVIDRDNLLRDGAGGCSKGVAKRDVLSAARKAADEPEQVTPAFDNRLKTIRFPIGVVDDTAYVGVMVPSRIAKGDKEFQRNELYLVTDKHELIHARNENLAAHGWQLESRALTFDRWPLEDIELWTKESGNPNPEQSNALVNPQTILETLDKELRRYLELVQEVEYRYNVLWSVGTYFHDLFNAFPYYFVWAIKRSGKTKNLTFLFLVCFNPIFSADMSSASLFRTSQGMMPTILIDETERLRNPERVEQIRESLNSGYKKGVVTVRTEKNAQGELEPRFYNLYCPKAMANISGMDEILEDRCKVTIIKRNKNKTVGDREFSILAKKWGEYRKKLYRLYLQHWREVKEIHGKLQTLVDEESDDIDRTAKYLAELTGIDRKQLNGLTGRELELWRAIFTMAIFFDNHAPPDKRDSLRQMVLLAMDDAKKRRTENITESAECVLVEALRELITTDAWYSVKDVQDATASKYDSPPQWLSTEWIGRALRRLELTEKRRWSTGVQYHIKPEQVQDLAERLGLVQEMNEVQEVKVLPKGEQTKLGGDEKSNSPSAVPTHHAEPTQPTPVADDPIHVSCCKWLREHVEADQVFNVGHFRTFIEADLNLEYSKVVDHLKKIGDLFDPGDGQLRYSGR